MWFCKQENDCRIYSHQNGWCVFLFHKTMEKEKSSLDYTVYTVSVHVPPSHKPQFCLKQVCCGKLLKETSHCFCENIFGPVVRLPDVPAVPRVTHLVCWDTRHNSVIPERYQTFLSACEGFHKRYVYFAFTTLFIILLINLLFPPPCVWS